MVMGQIEGIDRLIRAKGHGNTLALAFPFAFYDIILDK